MWSSVLTVGVGIDAAIDADLERLAAVFVDDVEQLQDPCV
jgi:hypothetical protein